MLKVLLRKEKLEAHLARKNLSQNWLARKLGISSGYMSQLLTGKRTPSPGLRQKMLGYFSDFSFDDLFEILK